LLLQGHVLSISLLNQKKKKKNRMKDQLEMRRNRESLELKSQNA
jgi:hypothetical protein